MSNSETKQFLDSLAEGELLSYIPTVQTNFTAFISDSISTDPSFILVVSWRLVDFFPSSQISYNLSNDDIKDVHLIPIFSLTFLHEEKLGELYLADIRGACWILEPGYASTYHPVNSPKVKPKPLNLQDSSPYPTLVPIAPLSLILRKVANNQ